MEGLDFEKISKHDFSFSPESEWDAEALGIHLIIVALTGESIVITLPLLPPHSPAILSISLSQATSLTSITVLRSLM